MRCHWKWRVLLRSGIILYFSGSYWAVFGNVCHYKNPSAALAKRLSDVQDAWRKGDYSSLDFGVTPPMLQATSENEKYEIPNTYIKHCRRNTSFCIALERDWARQVIGKGLRVFLESLDRVCALLRPGFWNPNWTLPNGWSSRINWLCHVDLSRFMFCLFSKSKTWTSEDGTFGTLAQNSDRYLYCRIVSILSCEEKRSDCIICISATRCVCLKMSQA